MKNKQSNNNKDNDIYKYIVEKKELINIISIKTNFIKENINISKLKKHCILSKKLHTHSTFTLYTGKKLFKKSFLYKENTNYVEFIYLKYIEQCIKLYIVFTKALYKTMYSMYSLLCIVCIVSYSAFGEKI